MTCADCRHFTEDPIGRAGLGDCAQKADTEVLMRQWHKDQWELARQGKLTYPGSEACGQFEK